MRLKRLLHDERGQAFFESFRSRENAGPLRLRRATRAADCVSSEAQKLKPSDFLCSTAPVRNFEPGRFLFDARNHSSALAFFLQQDLKEFPPRAEESEFPATQSGRQDCPWENTMASGALARKLLYPSAFGASRRTDLNPNPRFPHPGTQSNFLASAVSYFRLFIGTTPRSAPGPASRRRPGHPCEHQPHIPFRGGSHDQASDRRRTRCRSLEQP